MLQLRPGAVKQIYKYFENLKKKDCAIIKKLEDHTEMCAAAKNVWQFCVCAIITSI